MQDDETLPEFNGPPLSRTELERAAQSGLIKWESRSQALEAFSRSIDWAGWVRLWSGALGMLFLLSGVMFFFAHNWKAMSPILRLGVLEVAVTLAALAALVAGLRNTAGQALLFAASVLTGVLIAVYGQIFQTGADAFEVFAIWAVLIFAWVVAAKSAPLWMLWLIVAQVAVMSFGGQVLVPGEIVDWPAMYIAVGGFTVGTVALWEWLHRRESFDWLRGDWIRVILVGAALVWLASIPWTWIFDFESSNGQGRGVLAAGTLAWLVTVVVGAWFYTNARPSLLCMSLCVLCAAVVFIGWIARWLLDLADFDSALVFLLVGMIAIGVFAGAANLIIRTGRQIAARGNNATR